MTVAILSIGTELTRGEIVNTNATWLSEQLTELGFEVQECATIADDPKLIVGTLAQLANAHQVIVSTGGLGPTTDDITSECVAQLLGVPLERDEGGLEKLKQRFIRAGRKFHESNEKQLDFPQGALVLPNEQGTAPGFGVKMGRCEAYFMPGVPSEMKPMFTDSVRPKLGSQLRRGQHQIRFKTFGMPEAAVNGLLSGIEEDYGVTLGYRAHFPQIEVKVLARAETQAAAVALAERASNAVRDRLAKIIFAEGDATLAQAVGQLLSDRSLTLGLAESCTGGLVGHLICEHPASDYFKGGIVCYANEIKERVLQVNPGVIADKGAVSSEVAEQMAVGARQALNVDLALAITGIAGPSGGSEGKPVGLVHYAVASHQGVTLHHTSMPRPRDQVRLHAAFSGLWLVRSVLLKSELPKEG